MRLRVLLSLQLLFSIIVISAFIWFGANAFWSQFAEFLPTSVPVGGADVPLFDIAITYGAFLISLISLVFLFVFLIFDRLFIRPVKTITKSMLAFAESKTFVPFPSLTLTVKEIRQLANVFIGLTENVEQVHERDTEISRVKSDFISTAAHQLRTPLTGIRWALEALAKEPLNEFQKTLVDDAANKSRDLVAIVGTLLDISSIESGKHKYVFEPIDLVELLSGVVNDFTHQAAESKVILNPEYPQMPVSFVRADQQQIKWVLNNLIENAIKYTPAGGSVRISMAQVPGRVQILVHDTGIGITSKDRNNIFERFYRAENAIAKENTGNGLGLYIARTIATDHGGDLNFSPNEDGPGTTFTLSLPSIEE